MPNKAQYNNLYKSIREGMEKINSYTLEELIREKDLGIKLSFKDAEPDILGVFSLFNRIQIDQIIHVPYKNLQDLHALINDVISRFDQFKAFDPTAGNSAQLRNNLIQQFENKYQMYFASVSPILTAMMLDGNDFSAQQEKYNQMIKELEKKLINDGKKSEDYLSKMENVLSSAQDAAAKSGVSKYSNLFEKEAIDHEKKATTWLLLTLGVIIVIVIAASLLIEFFPGESARTGEIVQYTVSKIVILSSLFFVLSIFNRNYKAHKHNSVLNKHRQNALSTFETFSNASGSDLQTKNAVLIEATRTIFSNQQTGYLHTNETEVSNKIVEIIKGASSRGE